MSSGLYSVSNDSVPSADGMRFAIVVCEWNSNITDLLLQGAVDTLKKNGAHEENIIIKRVPGSFELIYGCGRLMEIMPDVDAIIAIGCIVKGDTPHFDFIAQGTTLGLAQLNAKSDIPVIFGVLTTNTMEQAEERAGGILGNKGDEYAITAIKMAYISHNL